MKNSTVVMNSTLSAGALVPWLRDTYLLSEPVSCEFYRKGICDTYRIKAADDIYYLKVYLYGRRTRLDVTEEVRLLNYCIKNGVSVVKPVMKKDGEYVSSLKMPEGMRYAVLFEEAEGVGEENNPARTKALGEMFGGFHMCADKMRGEYKRKHLDMKHLIDDNLDAISSLMKHRARDYAIIEGIGNYCKKQVLKLPLTKPEYGICHGDMFGGDVRYKPDNTPVIFDFDSSGYGWRAWDIGVYLTTPDWMDTSSKVEKLRQKKMSFFLEGYSKHRVLSDDELSVVQVTPPIHHIFLMGHVLRYNTLYEGNYWANDGFIDWHMKWFRYWAEKNCNRNT
jgi:Ser/Thr protein kinase RdoA (MazF antagonist)